MNSFTNHGVKYGCTGHSISERHSAVDDFFLELRQDTHTFAAPFLLFSKKSLHRMAENVTRWVII